VAKHDKGSAPDLREAPTVDRLIDQLSPLGKAVAPAAPSLPPPLPSISIRPPAPKPRLRFRPIAAPSGPVLVWMCVGLGVALAVALAKWPYARDCGWRLGFYIYAVGMLVVAGVWGVLISWKSRLGFAHSVALATMLWGLALAAQTFLPRVGYAKVQAGWACVVPPSDSRRTEMETAPAPEVPAEDATLPVAPPEPTAPPATTLAGTGISR
jgi:hypothetical protein